MPPTHLELGGKIRFLTVWEGYFDVAFTSREGHFRVDSPRGNSSGWCIFMISAYARDAACTTMSIQYYMFGTIGQGIGSYIRYGTRILTSKLALANYEEYTSPIPIDLLWPSGRAYRAHCEPWSRVPSTCCRKMRRRSNFGSRLTTLWYVASLAETVEAR